MPMTRGEREDLLRFIREQSKLRQAKVAEREAKLKALVEAQLAACFDLEDELWADLAKIAQAAVKRLNAMVIKRAREMGLREQFAGSFQPQWFSRGENARAERRAELRRLAQARNRALAP